MTKLLVLLAMLGYGGYKLHRKTERWLEMLRPLLDSPDQTHGAPAGSSEAGSRSSAEARALASDRSRAVSRVRRWLVLSSLYTLALVGLLTVGRWVTRTATAGGYDAGGEPAAETVARASSELAHAMLDHPLQRLLIPVWRVVDVRREPGHCEEPLGPLDLRDYVADVRLYTLFALPYRTVAVTCGGAVWWSSGSGSHATGRPELHRIPSPVPHG